MRNMMLMTVLLAALLPACKEERKGSPSISDAQARSAALQLVPGTVEKSELEHDDDAMVYEITIRTADGKRTEVKVDGTTGRTSRDNE